MIDHRQELEAALFHMQRTELLASRLIRGNETAAQQAMDAISDAQYAIGVHVKRALSFSDRKCVIDARDLLLLTAKLEDVRVALAFDTSATR